MPDGNTAAHSSADWREFGLYAGLFNALDAVRSERVSERA